MPYSNNDIDYINTVTGATQAGVDALAVDRFGKLQMTPAGMMERNLRVYRECIRHGVPLVITMGGGYSVPMDASVAAHADVYKSAALEYQEVLRKQEAESSQ